MERFEKIVHEYSPRLIGLAMRIVGDRDAAEDVVQDALVKAYQKLSSWRGEGKLSTWLYAIVYRQAISAVRGRKFGFSRELPDVADEEEDKECFDVTEENVVKMRLALEQLLAVDKVLVQLFYIDDKSIKECSQVCSLSEANVKVRLHRVRAKLKELMGK